MTVAQRHTTLCTLAILLALLVAMPVLGQSSDEASGKPADVPENGQIVVVGKEFKFTPNAIRVEKGREATIVFKNEGQVSHSLAIPELGVHTETIQTGAQDTLTFVAKKTGVYPFWCTVPGHKEAGMRGTVKIKE